MIGKNNPFNIRSNANNWIGLAEPRETRGFCNFRDIDFGIRAACILVLRSYRKADCLTVSEIINRFAPLMENNTGAYVDFVCSTLGVLPFDIPRSQWDFALMLNAMSIFEGNCVSASQIYCVMKDYNIKPLNRKKK